VLGLWAPAAQAAPAVSVPLDPDRVTLNAWPLNGATAAPTAVPVTYPLGSVAVQYSGSVTVTVPSQFTPGTPVAVLNFYPAGGGGIGRAYASDSAVPADQLVLTDVGSNQYRVDLPADDGTHVSAQMAELRLYGFSSPVPGDPGLNAVNALTHHLDFSGGGPASVPLASWVWVDTSLCADLQGAFCAITPVPQGTTTVEVSLPASTSLASAGLSDLRNVTFVQVAARENGDLFWGTSRVLSATVSADGRTATLTIPAGDFPDLFAIHVVARQGSTLVVSASLLFREQVANKGLRSNTGWGEHEGQASSGTSPLVPIGATMIVVAGASTALVLRRRTAPQA
jgi:hypothetical protein